MENKQQGFKLDILFFFSFSSKVQRQCVTVSKAQKFLRIHSFWMKITCKNRYTTVPLFIMRQLLKYEKSLKNRGKIELTVP